MSLPVLGLAVVATLCACSGPAQLGEPPSGPAEPQTAEAPAEVHFACDFHWRQSVEHPHTELEQVTVSGGARQITLQGFEVMLTADWADAPQLQVHTTLGDTAVRSVHVFEGKPGLMPKGALLGELGFTGLQYLTDDTGAELQYYCGSAGAGLEDDDAPPNADARGGMGPRDLPTDKVSCEASVSTADGEQRGTETFTIDPGGEREVAGLGPFVFSVRYQASRYETSAVIIDAGEPVEADSMPTVHTLYQFGAGPPANSMAGPSFTGMQSLEQGGNTLRYRCWTEG